MARPLASGVFPRGLWLLGLGAACGSPPPPGAPAPCPTSPALAAPSAPPVSAAAPARPALSLAVELPDDPAAPPRLAVTLDGPAADLAILVADEPPAAIAITDADGPVPATIDGKRVLLGRRAAPPIRAVYTLGTIAGGPRRALFSGARVLAPAAWDSVPIAWETATPKDPELHVASTLGATPPIVAPRERLARSTWLAGPGGVARFRAAEGHDDAAWVGYTAFEPRTIAAEIAVLRSSLGEVFGATDDRTSTTLFFVEPRERGDFLALRRAGGVVVRAGGGEPWGAPMRLAVAHELVHAYIGETVWLGPPGDARMRWFHEGVTRWVARERLLSAGLLDHAEYTHEVNGAFAALAASPLRAQPNDALARAARGGLLVQVARGATYAARVDALVRDKSQGKRHLGHLLRPLIEDAVRRRGELPPGAFEDLVAKELGEPERLVLRDAVDRGLLPPLPPRAFGPCFRLETAQWAIYDLGFDEDATRVAEDHHPAGFAREGPAARAGLRKDDAVVSVRSTWGNPDKDAVVTLRRGGDERAITFRPTSGRAPGFALRFVPGADKSCAALARR